MSSSEQAIFANLRASFDFDDAVASGNAVSPHYIPAPPKPESEEAMKVAVAKVHSHHRRLWSKKKSSKTAPKVEAWEAEPQAEPQAEPPSRAEESGGAAAPAGNHEDEVVAF